MSSPELFISIPRCTCADASDYVRSLVSATLLVGFVAAQRCGGFAWLWLRCGAALSLKLLLN